MKIAHVLKLHSTSTNDCKAVFLDNVPAIQRKQSLKFVHVECSSSQL